MWKPLVGVVGLAALAWAAQAQGAVTVLGGGFARDCSKAALAGESDRRFEQVCTLALDTELLGQRDRAGTFVNRGVLRMRRLDWTSAKADFDSAVLLKPDMGESYANRGAAMIGMRRYKEGLDDLNKAIAVGLEETEKAYYNRGLAHEGLDNLRAAYVDYQKALELKPEWDAPKRELARFTIGRR